MILTLNGFGWLMRKHDQRCHRDTKHRTRHIPHSVLLELSRDRDLAPLLVHRRREAERVEEVGDHREDSVLGKVLARADAPAEAERDVRRVGHIEIEREAAVRRREKEALGGECRRVGVDMRILEDRPALSQDAMEKME